jgi:glucose-6-phosphate 1-epimerase
MPASIGQQMQQLYSQFGELPGVTIELHKELLAVSVDNQQASATVFLQGAQLSHYQRRGEAALLWCSEHCDYQQGTSLRGGIPICWPWFGDSQRNPASVQQLLVDQGEGFPAHGLVRTRDWQLLSIDTANPDTTLICLQLSIKPDDEPRWPYACTLQLQISVGAELSLELLVTNHSPQVITYSCALHSYFAVSHIDHVSIEGVDQQHYVDCLDNWQAHQQQGSLQIDQEIDRIYRTEGQPIGIIDPQQRTISLSTEGSHSSVIWNPWITKSANLSHFGQQDYQQMLCVETANALDDVVQLAPEQQHRLQLTISTD